MPSKLGGLSLPAVAPFQPRKTEFNRFRHSGRSRARVAKLILHGCFSPFLVVHPFDSSTRSLPTKNAKYRTRCVPESTGGQNS